MLLFAPRIQLQALLTARLLLPLPYFVHALLQALLAASKQKLVLI